MTTTNDRLRVVVWNMNHWQRSAPDQRAAWQWLLTESGGDLALLQEAAVPDATANAIYRPIGGSRQWGSAVVGITVGVEEVTTVRGRNSAGPVALSHSDPGTVAIARASIGDGQSLTVVSIYGMIVDDLAYPTVRRQAEDLTPLLTDPDQGRLVLMGGDLNLTTQWTGRDLTYRALHVETFDRIRALGLFDCLDHHRRDGPLEGCGCEDGPACRHLRTQYSPKSPRPWQNDYVYATRPVLDATSVATVLDDDTVRAFSDHLPLVVEIETQRLSVTPLPGAPQGTRRDASPPRR